MRAAANRQYDSWMLGTSALIGFVATTQPERAKTFYRDVLGLRLVSDEEFALVFDANGTMLRIAKVDELRPSSRTVIGWSVDNIESAVRGLGSRGIQFERYDGLKQDDLGIWASDGGRIAWFKDPDGNVLSLTMFGSGL
jgi:catechol 2,3-dioxygenase-like lactoylglutathione lyase family enzyme